MTLEITRPETKALIDEYLKNGQFKDVEDLLLSALTLMKKSRNRPTTAASDQPWDEAV